MKLEMTTNWLPMIQPGIYGTVLGDIFHDVTDEYTKDFKTQLCFEAMSTMNEIFSEDWFVEKFGNVTVSNVTFHSPAWYNYENDSMEFDMEIEHPEKFIEEYYERFEAWDISEFFKWTDDNYGSRSGFISFFPYKSYDFDSAIHSSVVNKEGKYNFNRAIAMLIMFALEKSNCALDSYQTELEEAMDEYCYANGLYEDDED